MQKTKKLNVHTIIAIIFAIFLPIFLMIGCGETAIKFNTKSTQHTALNFYQGISNPVGIAAREQSYLTSYANNVVNQSAMSAAQKEIWQETTSNLTNFNNNIFAALVAVDAEKDNSINIYDLSKLNMDRASYFISKPTPNNTYIKSFYLKIPALHNNALLPTATASTATTDRADTLIKTWGNCLNFDVSLTNGNLYKVEINGGFNFPSSNDVQASDELASGGFKIVRDQNQNLNQIIIVYTEGSGLSAETFSKKVIFTSTTKTIEKYRGDITVATNPQKVGSPYTYTFDVAPLTGNYEIRMDASTSYLQCKFTNNPAEPGKYKILEAYELQDGHIICRVNNITGAQIIVQDFYFANDAISSRIKTKRTSGSINYIKLISEVNATEFGLISKPEQATSEKIMSFEITNKNLNILSVNY